jgi:hypothetical protein
MVLDEPEAGWHKLVSWFFLQKENHLPAAMINVLS